LLRPDEQRMLCALGVFVGGAEMEQRVDAARRARRGRDAILHHPWAGERGVLPERMTRSASPKRALRWATKPTRRPVPKATP